jgi:Fibronectin type III domain
VVSSDGRFLIHRATHSSPLPALWGLMYRDLTTRTAGVLPFPYQEAPMRLAAHPRRPVVYAAITGEQVGVLESAGLHRVSICSAPMGNAFSQVLAVTRRGVVILMACSRYPAGPELLMFDSQTGQVLRRLPHHGAAEVHPLADDNRLLIVRYRSGSFPFPPQVVALIDTVTGAEIVQRISPWANLQQVVWSSVNPSGDTLYVGYGALPVGSMQQTRTAMFRTDTLEFSGEVQVPNAFRAAFTPDGRRAAFLLWPDLGSFPLPRVRLSWFDLQQNTELAAVDLGYEFGTTSWTTGLALASPPLAPTSLLALREGRQVTLTWTLPEASPLATDYQIEVGTMPGASNLLTSRLHSTQTGLTVSGVLPGTYFVRLRAVNAQGLSDASNDVSVTVP